MAVFCVHWSDLVWSPASLLVKLGDFKLATVSVTSQVKESLNKGLLLREEDLSYKPPKTNTRNTFASTGMAATVQFEPPEHKVQPKSLLSVLDQAISGKTYLEARSYQDEHAIYQNIDF